MSKIIERIRARQAAQKADTWVSRPWENGPGVAARGFEMAEMMVQAKKINDAVCAQMVRRKEAEEAARLELEHRAAAARPVMRPVMRPGSSPEEMKAYSKHCNGEIAEALGLGKIYQGCRVGISEEKAIRAEAERKAAQQAEQKKYLVKLAKYKAFAKSEEVRKADALAERRLKEARWKELNAQTNAKAQATASKGGFFYKN